MTIFKFIRIFLPCIAGLCASIAFLKLHFFIKGSLYPETDEVLNFQPFDLFVFYPLYLIILVVAFIFQYFVAIPIWKMYTKERKLFNFKLWQITIIACFLFGIASGYCTWYKWDSVQALIFRILSNAVLAIVYWLINLIVLSMIDRVFLKSAIVE